MALVERLMTIVRSPSLRRAHAFPLALYPGFVVVVVAAALYRTLDFRGDVGGLVWAALVIAAFLTAFAPIAVGLRFDWIGPLGYAFAFLVATASFAVVPWAVNRAIAGDDNSTAGLLHLYDPLLDVLVVAAAVGIAGLARRMRSGRRSST